MIKVITIIGARPQIIKAAAISRIINDKFSNSIREFIVHTGQHYDDNMSAVFMRELNIPDEDRNLRVGSGTHAVQTALIMQGLESTFKEIKPDAVIIYGDTNSTLAAGITAAKAGIPVLHIEAGLRSYNKQMPEEINRICCDHVSTLLFAPTRTAVANLQKEGFNVNATPVYTIDNPGVFLSGDVMFDNSLYFAGMAKERSFILDSLQINKGEFILATVHRESNTDITENLSGIFRAFLEIAERHQQVIIVPLHPRTRKMMHSIADENLKQKISGSKFIKLTEPASFLDMTLLESECSMVITDSGGVQKEAYFFGKPCIILRDETEWVELIDTGCGILAGTSPERIVKAFLHFKGHTMQPVQGLFGDGNASLKICSQIVQHVQSIV